MRRTALIVLAAAAGLVALLLIGVAIAIATVDPDRFIAPLAARVKAATGRDLTVQGPVEIAFSLAPKIVLPGVAFGNAPGSKSPQMLTAKRVEVQIALLPLLSRRFDVVRFTLVEPVIALETDARGHGNWEFDAPGAGTPGSSAGSATPAAAVGIANFEIRGGTLTYSDNATGKLTRAAIERMTLHARDMQSPVAVDFRGRIDDVPVALAGDLGAPDAWLRQQWPYPVALKGEIGGKAVRLDTKVVRAGTTTTLGDLDVAYGALAGKGSIKVINDGAHTRYAIELTVPSLSIADFAARPVSQPNAAPPAPPPPGALHWIIPDTPLPLAPFIAVDSEGSITIGKLTLASGQLLEGVGAQFTSRDAKLDARFTAGRILGGTMHGRLQLDGRNAGAPGVHLSLDAKDLDLGALAAAAGIRRDIRGGKVRANVDIDGRGTTPHRVASTMSGTILVVSGPASLGRSGAQGESALAQLAGALDPLQTVDATTELRCAVFRLPLTDGIAHVDRSIAIETAKLAASASGTLNFRDETLDLSVQPQIREGVKIDVSQFAGLVRIRGRFDKPTVGIDAAQSAELLARIGALAATGGTAAVVAGALLGSSGAVSAPCAVAMAGKAPREATPSRSKGHTPTIPGIPEDVGKALGKLFGR